MNQRYQSILRPYSQEAAPESSSIMYIDGGHEAALLRGLAMAGL